MFLDDGDTTSEDKSENIEDSTVTRTGSSVLLSCHFRKRKEDRKNIWGVMLQQPQLAKIQPHT
jgi:hypothetical protein